MHTLDYIGIGVIAAIIIAGFSIRLPKRIPEPRPARAPAQPLTFGKLVLGVFLGILLAGIVGGLIYAALAH